MIKISYETLALEIEKLYQKEFTPHDPAITAHCEFIAEFIRSCGWDESEYWEKWMEEQEKIPSISERNSDLN